MTGLICFGRSKNNEASPFVSPGSKTKPKVKLTSLVIGHGSTIAKLDNRHDCRNELSGFRD